VKKKKLEKTSKDDLAADPESFTFRGFIFSSFFGESKTLQYVAEPWFEGTPPNLILMEFLGVYEGKSFFHGNFKCKSRSLISLISF
jgi:hypothetical protein